MLQKGIGQLGSRNKGQEGNTTDKNRGNVYQGSSAKHHKPSGDVKTRGIILTTLGKDISGRTRGDQLDQKSEKRSAIDEGKKKIRTITEVAREGDGRREYTLDRLTDAYNPKKGGGASK